VALAQAGCDFAAVRQQIDIILDRDVEKGAKFRREVASGSDSLVVLRSLLPVEVRDRIDVCHLDTAQYLSRRGFSPGSH
jgi:hypothetical protein